MSRFTSRYAALGYVPISACLRDGQIDPELFQQRQQANREFREQRQVKRRVLFKIKAPRKTPIPQERLDPKTSFWWQHYVLDKNKTYRDPEHRHGKLFRSRFRVPWVEYDKMVCCQIRLRALIFFCFSLMRVFFSFSVVIPFPRYKRYARKNGSHIWSVLTRRGELRLP